MNEKDFRALRFYIRSVISCYPGVYFPFLHILRSPRRHLHVRRDTEIVIEGYPRSANTFAVAAFRFAQGRPVRIAHHLHAPAQIIQAVLWGIPTLVLIRKPEDAVLSLLVREPVLSARQALADYIRFHKKIRPYRSGFVLATFEEVISDFGSVIGRLNHKFGTTFMPFVHNAENVAVVMKIIEEMDKADQRKPAVTETTVARPSSARDRLKQQRRRELEMPEVSELMETAKRVYEEMIQQRTS